MNKEKVMGIIRHVLTGAGTLVTYLGYTDATTWMTITGGIVALVGVAWSIMSPEKGEAVVANAKAQGLLSK